MIIIIIIKYVSRIWGHSCQTINVLYKSAIRPYILFYSEMKLYLYLTLNMIQHQLSAERNLNLKENSLQLEQWSLTLKKHRMNSSCSVSAAAKLKIKSNWKQIAAFTEYSFLFLYESVCRRCPRKHGAGAIWISNALLAVPPTDVFKLKKKTYFLASEQFQSFFWHLTRRLCWFGLQQSCTWSKLIFLRSSNSRRLHIFQLKFHFQNVKQTKNLVDFVPSIVLTVNNWARLIPQYRFQLKHQWGVVDRRQSFLFVLFRFMCHFCPYEVWKYFSNSFFSFVCRK